MVLHQDESPIVFYDRHVAPRHYAKLAAYKHELIGLVKAMRHRHPHMWARSFVVCTENWIWLLLHQRLAASITNKFVAKVAPLFYDPFRILKRDGTVAYRRAPG